MAVIFDISRPNFDDTQLEVVLLVVISIYVINTWLTRRRKSSERRRKLPIWAKEKLWRDFSENFRDVASTALGLFGEMAQNLMHF